MTFHEIHNNKNRLLLQCLSGSKAYGLDNPLSDTDIKGVFFTFKRELFGLRGIEQVSDETNDIVYYELKRFIELLLRNNPNILELLATPKEAVLYKRPIMDVLKPEMFLSKLCYKTFAGYAESQIKKAKGLNKKIYNPIDKQRKTVFDFCYILKEAKSQPLISWLNKNDLKQEKCGLVKIDHFKDVYALFYEDQNQIFNGIYSGDTADDVKLSSVPEGIKPICYMVFNKDAFSIYCKDYKEYWSWAENRNEERFKMNVESGRNYDTKNMMHTFRLLKMANEIAIEGRINVRRSDKEFLFKIKSGEFAYEELLNMSNSLLEEIKSNYEKSFLPETPDEESINDLLIEIRTELLK